MIFNLELIIIIIMKILFILLCILLYCECYKTNFYHLSNVIDDNSAPFIPPAREVAWLYPTDDQLNYNIKINIGSPKQTLYLVLDSASGEALLFSKSQCDNSNSIGLSVSTCYDSSSSSSYVPTGVTKNYGIIVDNDEVSDVAIIFTDNFSMSSFRIGQEGTERDTASLAATAYLSNSLDIKYRDSLDIKTLHKYKFSSGIIGIGYSGLASSGSSTLLKLLNLFPYDLEDQSYLEPIFSIDVPYIVNVGDKLEKGKLYIGGISENARNNLIWGPKLQNPYYHEFQIYDFSICNNNLTSLSYSYRAVIDTGASCLGLAEELFDMLISWIPIECEASGYRCYLPLGIHKILPTLSFALSSGGDKLYLPLHDLLISLNDIEEDNTINEYRYCITRLASFTQLTQTNSHHIIFGSRTLMAFHIAFNMKSKQVAIGNKQTFEDSQVQCRLAKLCSGMQKRDATTNSCKNPNCDEYYFFTFDESSHQCKLTISFHVLVVLFITLIVGAEIFMFELEKHITDKVNVDLQST